VTPREPHPLATHIAIDCAVAFCALLVVGLIIGVPVLVIAVVAVVAGVCVAPYTRRTEERQLAAIEAEREASDDDDGVA